MPRIWVRVMLFFSSYIPLMIIFAILNWTARPTVTVVMVALALLSGGVLLAFVRVNRRRARREARVQHARRLGNDVLNYVAAYIIPFVSLPFNDIANGLAVLVLFATLLTISVQANLIAINPMLAVCGYSVYEIMLADQTEPVLLLSRRTIGPGQPLSVVPLGRGVYLDQTRHAQSFERRDTLPPTPQV